ncbi:group II truncated hemoglobin [bacterium]|nr:group II truncated hemoglobin [bacterium]
MGFIVRDLFQKLGEEKGIRILVDAFYDFMDELPEAKAVRELHEADLTESRNKLYEFLVGWSGGPPLYVEKHGHPRLRMRHLPFAIGRQERDEWLLCMNRALEAHVEDVPAREFLQERFNHIATFLQNQ